MTEIEYSHRDHIRIGGAHFIQRGFHVRAWDFQPILHPHLPTRVKTYSIPNVESVAVTDEKQFSDLLKNVQTPAILITFGMRDRKLAEYYRKISRAGIQIALVFATHHAVSFCDTGVKRGLSQRCLSMIRTAKNRFFDLVSFYPVASVVFGAGTITREIRHPLRTEETKFIPIQSYDCDRLLEAEASTYVGLPKKFAVFLDEYLPFHPDYRRMQIPPPAEPESYYRHLNGFFDQIEKQYGTTVVIAAHPRSEYEKGGFDHWYGDRVVIRGATAKLVSESTLVLAHASTAISFVVLKDKPILLLDSMAPEWASMRAGIDSLVRNLDLPRIYYDQDSQLPPFDSLRLSQRLRENFTKRFLCEGTPFVNPSYEVIANYIDGIKLEK